MRRFANDYNGNRQCLACHSMLHAHQTPDHGSLLKSYRESEITPIGNPLCQHLLDGSGHPLIITSATAASKEDDDGDPGYARYPSEQATLAMTSQDVRSMVMRLPPTVHGAGDKNGFVPQLLALARDTGVSAWIGDGQNRWPSIHRLDAAHLFRLALENGLAGSRYHAVDESGVPTKDIAEAIGRRLNLPAISLPKKDAAEHFGFLGHVLTLDIHASSAATRDILDWQPVQPGLLEDIEHGTYSQD